MYIECQGVLWGLHCVPLVLFGEPWALFGTPWGAIGMPWGTLWGTWDCIGVSWGCLGTTSGHLGLDVGMSGDHFGTYWNFGLRRNPLPSTRAGDQDDVSFTNYLKICVNDLYIYIYI